MRSTRRTNARRRKRKPAYGRECLDVAGPSAPILLGPPLHAWCIRVLALPHGRRWVRPPSGKLTLTTRHRDLPRAPVPSDRSRAPRTALSASAASAGARSPPAPETPRTPRMVGGDLSRIEPTCAPVAKSTFALVGGHGAMKPAGRARDIGLHSGPYCPESRAVARIANPCPVRSAVEICWYLCWYLRRQFS